MKIKIGKYKNCVKKLIRYGFTEEAAKITCGNVAIEDKDWEVEKRVKEEEDPSKWETEVAEEEPDVKKRKTTPAGGKAVKREKGKERPVHTEPKAMQMPLYQPWRAYKSEHRLQTKLEKVQTAEQKFLTMEQLLKRAEYALAIKKKDAAPFMVYAIPEELWDQAGIGPKEIKTDKETGLVILEWKKTAGGQAYPILATREGPMPKDEAMKAGYKAAPITTIGQRLKERGLTKGEIPFVSPRTAREVAAEKSAEKDKQFDLTLENLTERSLEIKSPYQKVRERQEKQKAERISPIEQIQEITKEQMNQMEGLEVQIKNIEEHSSFQQIGTDPTEVEPDWDNLPEEDLWAYVSRDLNFTLRGRSDEYAKIRASMGVSPIIYGEYRNVIHEMEAISRITNPYVLDDFIIHTKNYVLKEQAMNQLKNVDPEYYEKAITEKVKTLEQAKITYKLDPESAAYKKQKDKLNKITKMKEQYMTQGAGGSHEYFTTKQEKGQRNYPSVFTARQLNMKPDEEGEKFHDPDAGYQELEKMGLAKGGKITTEINKGDLEPSPEERVMERFLKKAK